MAKEEPEQTLGLSLEAIAPGTEIYTTGRSKGT